MLKDSCPERRFGKCCMTALHAKLPRVLTETLIMGAALKIRALRMHLAFLYREGIRFELRCTLPLSVTLLAFLRLSSIHVTNPEMPDFL